MQNSRKNIVDTLASAPTQATQDSAARPNGEHQAERCKTAPRSTLLAMLNTATRAQKGKKETSGRLNK